MKSLPAGFQAHLDSGTTTLCHCWKLQLASGEALGFTDHDMPLSFDGVSFEAAAGFTASEIESAAGLGVDNMEAKGALQSTRLDEARLKAGDFDHAAIEIWRVNWQDVNQRVLLRKGNLGEVAYGNGAFTAEVRGLAHVLNQTRGRLYQFGCDATLGDARCGVNLAGSSYQATGSVVSAQGASLVLQGIGFVDDWATRGTLIVQSGPQTGKSLAVKRQRQQGTLTRVELWQALPFALEAGTTVALRAGCDRQFATCRAKFFNAANFRGFPHMPGTDFVAAFASQNDANNNGGRRSSHDRH